VADVTIRNESTSEERVVPEEAVPFFVNQEHWVVLDKAGRKAAHQPTASKES
jgi:hypothetical protein